MSDYIIFNYDNNERIVKMWSPRGEIGRASAPNVNTSNVVLRVEASGRSIKAYINGRLVIDPVLSESEPTEAGNYWHYNADGEVEVWNVA